MKLGELVRQMERLGSYTDHDPDVVMWTSPSGEECVDIVAVDLVGGRIRLVPSWEGEL